MPHHGEDDYCGGPTFKLTQWGNAIITEDLRGHLVRIGADWQTEIQAALDALTPGRTWMEKIEVWAQRITLNASIDMVDYDLTALHIHGELYLADGVNAPIININDGATATMDIDIFIERVNGNRAGNLLVDLSPVIEARYVFRMTLKILHAHDVQGGVCHLRDSDWNTIELDWCENIVNSFIDNSWSDHNKGYAKGQFWRDDDALWLQGNSRYNEYVIIARGGKEQVPAFGGNFVRLAGEDGNECRYNKVLIIGWEGNSRGVHIGAFAEENEVIMIINDLVLDGLYIQGDRNRVRMIVENCRHGAMLEGEGNTVQIKARTCAQYGAWITGDENTLVIDRLDGCGSDGVRLDGVIDCVVGGGMILNLGGGMWAVREIAPADWNLVHGINVHNCPNPVLIVGGNSISADNI